jgi:serine kinase of HPr protein (carbohydrate metabolism regulator)
MTLVSAVSETVHATCLSVEGCGVLLLGRSGSGKSDLALRLIDRGARLVSDDYTILSKIRGRLIATPPPSIKGKFEVRGIGILDWENDPEIEITAAFALDEPVERLPNEDVAGRVFAGMRVPVLSLNALEASAPIKLEIALRVLKAQGRA